MLTKRQRQIYDFLRDYLEQHGYSPTLEEIAEHFQMASLNGVYKHLTALEDRGFIRRLPNQARSIQIRGEEPPRSVSLPLLGIVAAGQPIEAVSSPEEISVPETLLRRGNHYVLRVRGDSMIDEQIRDGDWVIVQHRQQAENGDLVIALLDGEAVTLKKYYREGSRIRLQPANPLLSPLYVEEEQIQIQGIVVGVLRKYH